MTNDWRIEVDGFDYLRNRQKELAFEQRRPTPRKASDLGLGPGLGMSAVRLDDYNDILATLNGFYASAPGAANAPNASGEFVGFVSMDSEIGGIQVFTDMETGVEYRRRFNRYPGDESVILWGDWASQGGPTPVAVHNGFRTTTVAAAGVSTPLLAPALDTEGPDGYFGSSYASSGTTLSLLKPGVYTGHVYVEGPSTASNAGLVVTVPFAGGVKTFTINSGTFAPGFSIPFTAVLTGGGPGLITVAATQNSSTTKAITWREFSCTRVGDA